MRAIGLAEGTAPPSPSTLKAFAILFIGLFKFVAISEVAAKRRFTREKKIG